MVEMYINKKLIADIPDQTGVYETPVGQISVDASGIYPGNEVQRLLLSGEILKGRPGASTESGQRVLDLSKHGISEQTS